ncbi:hypothetical protein GCM10028808_22980 [Spirosoma migulaei]
MPNVDPALRFRFPLDQQLPRLGLRGIPGGGTQRTVTVNEFPISATMARSIIELQPDWFQERPLASD